MFFQDRTDAGRQLGDRLAFLNGTEHLVVLGVPRGGVVVAEQVARALAAPLDVFIAHKIGAPGNPELAIGAISDPGEVWLDEEMVDRLGLSADEVAREIETQRAEMERRLVLFRGNRPPLSVTGKTVILVDDGIATGATVLVCLRALRKREPSALYLAVPVGPPDAIATLSHECDGAIALATPEPFWAVSRFYRSFAQVEDTTVVEILADLHGVASGT